MYCSSCGAAVAQGLSYCNLCGAKLVTQSDSVIKAPDVKPEMLVSAILVLFVLGLVALGMLMGIMKVILELPVESVLAFALVPFLLMLGLEGVFIRLLLKGKRGANAARETLPGRGHATKELDAAHPRALSGPTSSVTEHTTRAFDPIYTDRTSK